MDKTTKAIHTPFRRPDAYGAISMPVYHTAAYRFDTSAEMVESFAGRSGMPDYSRVTNPTVYHLEDTVKALTGADNVFALTSGMAAIATALMSVVQDGGKIITSRHLFGNTSLLLTKTLGRLGIRTHAIDLTNLDEVQAAVTYDTCCIFLEAITNPQLEVANIRAIAQMAHKAGIPVICDTTAIPFTEFSAKSLGVDIEVVSATKYVSGGGTSIGGLIMDYGTFPEISKRIQSELMFTLGAYMTPHVAYMMSLGLETLEVRYRRQADSALRVARALQEMPGVKSVNYIGLPENPYHKLALQQFGPTGGAMLTFDLANKQACFNFLDKLQLICRATNLFDNKSLAIHPYSTIFVNFTPKEKAEMDILPTTIRLSIGLEDPDDIITDLKSSL